MHPVRGKVLYFPRTLNLYREKTMKKFIAYWGEGYGDQVLKLVTLNELNYFYSDDDCPISFDDMAQGQILDLSCITGTHYVIRVK
jgi:hypothetical protein